MSVGRVKWFNSDKGYGFIETVECTQDVFVHFSEIEMDGYKKLEENMVVRFELEKGDKGPCAKRVNRMDWIDDRWKNEADDTAVPVEAEASLGDMSHLWQSAPAPVNVQRG